MGKFHYYYLIQDILGVFISFFSFRIFINYLKLCISKGINKERFYYILIYILYFFCGLNLLIFKWSLKTWFTSIFVFTVVFQINKLLNKKFKI